MKQKTQTRIGRLRQGDRFYLLSDKKKVVYQLDSFSREKAKYVKVLNDQPSNSWMYAKETSVNKEVIFLRHTLLQPGDECFLQDLNEGDKFYKLSDPATLYTIVKNTPNGITLAPVGEPDKKLYSHPLSAAILAPQTPQLN